MTDELTGSQRMRMCLALSPDQTICLNRDMAMRVIRMMESIENHERSFDSLRADIWASEVRIEKSSFEILRSMALVSAAWAALMFPFS